MEKLIEDAEEILVKYKNKSKEEGLDYNIFSIMNMERSELLTHENMIYTILNLGQERGLQIPFTNLFLEAMGVPNEFLTCEWSVEREYYIGAGRIDLFFKSKGEEKLCVAVEIKIDADDQESQLKRYDHFLSEIKYNDYRIIYLTLDGKDATEKSVDGIKDFTRILNRSFEIHILDWLRRCITVCEKEKVDTSFIKQYEILVRKITNEEHMESELKELIKGSKKIKACIAITTALQEVEMEIVYRFFDELYNELDGKCEITNCYYEYGTKYSYITCKIRDIRVRNQDISIAFCIEVDDRSLVYSVIYSDKNGELIDSNSFKEKNRRIGGIIENAIAEALKTNITENRYLCIKYFNVKNSENKEYDFKHFDNICAELGDDDIMKREVKYISGNMLKYIQDIGDALDEVI